MGLIVPASLYNLKAEEDILVFNVADVCVDPSSNYYLVGDFSTINAQPRTRLAKINVLQTLDGTFLPTANNIVYDCDYYDNKVYIAGEFTQVNSNANSRYIGIVDSTDGTNEVTFNAQPNSIVYSILVDPSNGDFFIGGQFTAVGATSRLHIAKLNAATNVITTFQANTNGTSVRDLAFQKTNTTGLYIAGNFTTVRGTTRRRLAKINRATGILDGSFNANAFLTNNHYVEQIKTHTAIDRVVARGYIVSSGVVDQYFVAEFSSDGTFFGYYKIINRFSGEIYTVHVDPNDDVLVTYRQGSDYYIDKYTSVGVLDNTFGTSGTIISDGPVTVIKDDNSPNYVMTGVFNTINGVSRNGFAILSSSGTVL